MVITDDDAVADRVRLLRQQADASVAGGEKYTHPMVGYNSRLDEVQAAVLRLKLPRLDAWNARRVEHANLYRKRLAGSGIGLPAASVDGSHIYSLFTLRCPWRDELRARLAERGIGSAIYYPVPLHLQGAYRDLGYENGSLPVAERLAREVVSIPLYPELTVEQVEAVADAVLESAAAAGRPGAEERVGHEL
jgi:dTDP-4-amino-4,6-dideoxygalactose transaminase